MQHAKPIAIISTPQAASTAWLYNGNVYLAPTSNTVFNRNTMLPECARWESSENHWNHYWTTVHQPAGWRKIESK